MTTFALIVRGCLNVLCRAPYFCTMNFVNTVDIRVGSFIRQWVEAVEGSDWLTPLSPDPICFLRPCGPSDMHRLGTPRRRIGFVYMKSVPDTSAAFSSTVIWDKTLSIFKATPSCRLSGFSIAGRAKKVLHYGKNFCIMVRK